MAAGLILSALEIGKRVPPIPGIARIPRALARAGARFSPVARAAFRGAATPFLPCGLLYGAFLTAAAAGSLVGGALVMLAFGAGAVPALTLAQSGLARLAAHPRAYAFTRRAVPVGAAVILVWRALVAGDGATPPHCH
jgi:sulfite exporter TauE/SafE